MTELPKNEPTWEEVDALNLFAKKHGAKWKDELLTAWCLGRDVASLPHDKGCYLRRVRNRLGPSWLATYGSIEVTRN